MIYNERDLRPEVVRSLAEAVMVAARTAPKAKGRDLVEIAMVTEDDIYALAAAMRRVSERTGLKFLLRDADNIERAQAVILIGTREAGSVCGLNCGYCGSATCEAKPCEVPCVMNSIDVGIAIGSACAKVADLRLDSRVMFSVGWAAKLEGVMPDVDQIIAIPLSASSKNIFFDRQSSRPAEEPKK